MRASPQAKKNRDRKPRDEIKASEVAKIIQRLNQLGLRDSVATELGKRGKGIAVGLRRDELLQAVIEACRELPKARLSRHRDK